MPAWFRIWIYKRAGFRTKIEYIDAGAAAGSKKPLNNARGLILYIIADVGLFQLIDDSA
jgi:hypothetical protein